MISRTTFCSAQASVMRFARTRPMAGHLAQPLGFRLDDIEHLLAERPHQLAPVLKHLPNSYCKFYNHIQQCHYPN